MSADTVVQSDGHDAQAFRAAAAAQEAQAFQQEQAMREAELLSPAPIIAPPAQPPQKEEMSSALILFVSIFVLLCGASVLALYIVYHEEPFGMRAVFKVFDKTLGILLEVLHYSLVCGPMIFIVLQIVILIFKRMWVVVIAFCLITLGVTGAFTYASVAGIQVRLRALDWQEQLYPASGLEVAIKTEYDRGYCVAVGRDTCNDMSVKKAASIFFPDLTEWATASYAYSLNELCDANPDKNLTVCKSCAAVKANDDAFVNVKNWEEKQGGYDRLGVVWCGFHFGTGNDTAESLSMAPYNNRRAVNLKEVASRMTKYIILDVLIAVSVPLVIMPLSLSLYRDWRAERRQEVGYVQHVDV